MMSVMEIYRCTDLELLRSELVGAVASGDNATACALAWQAGAVARADRTGQPIQAGVDMDFDAEWRRATATIRG